jgi:Mn2+/Fe2+ NRAMP family transporter
MAYLVVFSILLGCAAYEAGNILGAVAGASLLLHLPNQLLTFFLGSACIALLWFTSTKKIALLLGVIVGVMGICFLSAAVIKQPPLGKLISGLSIPKLPDGSEFLVIGLIGTTVVPYNLFLGSGLAHGQNLKEMRISLSTAIVLGGIISMGILVTGNALTGHFSYEALAQSMADELGSWTSTFFGLGLCAAGFSSALTAPLAASITARSMLGLHHPGKWHPGGARFRIVWLGILLTGMIFGLLDIQPIPAIILAQALNGIILPFVSVFLWLAINDARLLDDVHINTAFANIAMGIIVFVTLILGLTSIFKAMANLLSSPFIVRHIIIWSAFITGGLIYWPIIKKIRAYRQK